MWWCHVTRVTRHVTSVTRHVAPVTSQVSAVRGPASLSVPPLLQILDSAIFKFLFFSYNVSYAKEVITYQRWLMEIRQNKTFLLYIRLLTLDSDYLFIRLSWKIELLLLLCILFFSSELRLRCKNTIQFFPNQWALSPLSLTGCCGEEQGLGVGLRARFSRLGNSSIVGSAWWVKEMWYIDRRIDKKKGSNFQPDGRAPWSWWSWGRSWAGKHPWRGRRRGCTWTGCSPGRRTFSYETLRDCHHSYSYTTLRPPVRQKIRFEINRDKLWNLKLYKLICDEGIPTENISDGFLGHLFKTYFDSVRYHYLYQLTFTIEPRQRTSLPLSSTKYMI